MPSKRIREQSEESSVVSSVSQVQRLLKSKQASVGPASEIKSRKKIATANFSMGGSYGGFGNAGATMGNATNIYSPHLSTDFLELPQNLTEMRAYYRHFYNNDPYVGQAIDLHTELPLSRLRLNMPRGKDPKRNREILTFFQNMVDRVDLLEALIDATREYYVVGEAFIFAEDSDIEIPEYVYKERINQLDPETGETTTKLVERENADELRKQYEAIHYQGWDRLILLPPDQVQIETFQFTHKTKIELIPDDKTTNLVKSALHGDPYAAEQLEDVPDEIIEYITNGENLPLSNDPEKGSFVYHLSRKKSSFQDHGVSVLQRCIRTLIYRDKLRQAQTSIASRAMTPKRLIYAEDMDEYDVEDLREQVDLSLMDPDYSIITNFEVRWEEISANDRLLNLSSEYDITDRQLFAGLGVTESMLTGESTYSGERINIEVINTRYMLYRERLQTFVEENLFKPVAKRKGFTEMDEFGNQVVLYPRLSFTRLALRDNRDTFDSMFNLYQKGSLSVDYILELFNLDPQAVKERLLENLMTVNDAMFNEIIRSAYGEAGRMIPEQSDLVERLVDYLELEYREPEEGGGRY